MTPEQPGLSIEDALVAAWAEWDANPGGDDAEFAAHFYERGRAATEAERDALRDALRWFIESPLPSAMDYDEWRIARKDARAALGEQ